MFNGDFVVGSTGCNVCSDVGTLILLVRDSKIEANVKEEGCIFKRVLSNSLDLVGLGIVDNNEDKTDLQLLGVEEFCAFVCKVSVLVATYRLFCIEILFSKVMFPEADGFGNVSSNEAFTARLELVITSVVGIGLVEELKETGGGGMMQLLRMDSGRLEAIDGELIGDISLGDKESMLSTPLSASDSGVIFEL